MRLAIIGGGGFRVPLVYGALFAGGSGTGQAPEPSGITEVALYDSEPARVRAIGHVLSQLAAGRPGAPRVVVCTDLDDALRGAAFVFCAIRVGGLSGRTIDERSALDLGLLGQETTGPGGVCYGLRTVPVMVEIASRIAAVAPDAWTINFTNPAGMITEAMSAVLGDRVLGICDTPVGLFGRVADHFGVDEAQGWFDYFGLNHLGWLRSAYVAGRDRLPELLADDEALLGMEEGRLFGPAWIRSLGMIPNEYLHYYYNNRDAIASITSQPQTRGEFLLDQQARFYAEAEKDPSMALREWKRTLREREDSYMADAVAGTPTGTPAGTCEGEQEHREGGGYERVAVAVMRAISGHGSTRLVLNTRNRGALPCLDDDAVVEVPCLVDSNGAHPVAVGSVPAHAAGLMTSVKAVERTTIEAALTGSRSAAVRALALHPLVDSVRVAEELLAAYLSSYPSLRLT